MTPAEQIAELKAIVEQQREQIAVLLERVRELEGRLAKDSHNSSKPPSSDGLGRKTKSLRRPSGRKSGGQLGHRGETLRLVATPEVVEEHRPAACATCQAPLGADAPVMGRERRQVMDLPPVHLRVTEHQALHVQCSACQAVSVGAFPAEAASRAQYGPRLRALVVYLVEHQFVPYARVQQLLADLFGAALSQGTLVACVQAGAAALAPVEAQLTAALGQAPVLHSDETGVRRAGRLAWLHVACTAQLTHYAIHPKRGREATDAIGILPTYQGVSVHDGWKPYRANAACRHALCNIHHLRELTFLEEQEQQAWAKELKDLLREMKTATDQARLAGQSALAAAAHDAFVARYDQVLATGLAANPPPERRPHQRGRLKQSLARNLLERLLLGKGEVLAFLGDLTIPFDNNQAERDLRLIRVQQKISGCFRSDAGATAGARLRSYLSTLRKQGYQLLAALQTLFAGQLFYPDFA